MNSPTPQPGAAARAAHTLQLADNLASEINTMEKRAKLLRSLRKVLLPISGKCSDSVRYDMSAGIPFIYVYNRDDLQQLLSLCPRWNKEPFGKNSIDYFAEFSGFLIHIRACDAALPPTCKVEKKTRLVEAVPAHEVTEEVLVCTGPVFNEPTLQEARP